MRISMAIWSVLLMAAGCAMAQPAAPDNQGEQPVVTIRADLAPDTPIDQILDALDVRGDTLKSFVADVSLTESDTSIGEESTRTGKIWFQNLGKDNSRVRVTFENIIRDRRARDEKIEYVLDKGWLTERNYRKTNEVRRQVLRPGEKMNIIKLGEGPFPLPIGQDKADVHRMFEVKKIEPKKDDPADTIHLQLIPKPGTRLAEKFKTIDFWVHQHSHMPVQIDTVDVNENSTQRTQLKNVQINAELTDADFTLPDITGKGWQQVSEAMTE